MPERVATPATPLQTPRKGRQLIPGWPVAGPVERTPCLWRLTTPGSSRTPSQGAERRNRRREASLACRDRLRESPGRLFAAGMPGRRAARAARPAPPPNTSGGNDAQDGGSSGGPLVQGDRPRTPGPDRARLVPGVGGGLRVPQARRSLDGLRGGGPRAAAPLCARPAPCGEERAHARPAAGSLRPRLKPRFPGVPPAGPVRPACRRPLVQGDRCSALRPQGRISRPRLAPESRSTLASALPPV